MNLKRCARYSFYSSFRKMFRIGRLRSILVFFCFFAFLYLFLYNQHLETLQKISENTNRILKIVDKNTSCLLLPDESTSIVQPSRSNLCKGDGSSHFLLFMFVTAPGNFAQRMTLREVYNESIPVWDKLIQEKHHDYKLGESIKTFFFIGISENKDENTRLIEEAHKYEDIIIDDFNEAYLNLTLKTLRMLKWVEHNCPQARYLVKIDDDVHLNVPMLLEFLNNYNGKSSNLIAGYKYSNISADSDPFSKWFTPTILWSRPLPDFVAGFFYVMGSQVRADLYKNSLKVPFFHLEDVFLTGMVRERFTNANVTNIPNIHVFWPISANFYDLCIMPPKVAIHPLPSKKIKCFSKFASPNFKCFHWLLFTFC